MDQNSLTEQLEEIVVIFDETAEPLTTPEIADRLDLGRRTTYNRLERLVENNHLKTKKVGASARIWWRPKTPFKTGDDGNPHVGQSEPVTRVEQQFHSLVKATDEYAIFLLDSEGYVQTWNPGAARIKGYDADDILDEHFSTFYTEEDRESGIPERNLRAAAHEGSIQDEGWRLRDDGSRFWANVTLTALRDDEGGLIGYVKVARSMTDRWEYEQQLHEENAFVESVLDTQQDVLYAIDTDGQFLRWNDRFREVTGYTDAEIEDMQPVEFIAERAADETTAAIAQVLEHGKKVKVELPLVTADGDEIPYEFTGGPITDETGEIVGLTGTGRDTSERKARERRLERLRDDLQAELDDIFTRIDEAFFALDDDWRITYVNDRAAKLVDLSVGELLQARVRDVLPEVTEGYPREMVEQAVETQESVEFEFYSELLDIWVEIRTYPSEMGLSIYVRDVTERKERERELEVYESIIDAIEDGIYVLDDDYCFTEINDAYVEMTGYDREELLGAHCSLVVSEDVSAESFERTQEIAEEGGESAVIEADIHCADGSRLRAESHFTALPSDDGTLQKVGVVRDVSERVAHEQKLRDRVRQLNVVSDLGQRALEEQDLDALLADAAELVATTLDTDYCKVLDLDADAEELLLRQGVGWDEDLVGDATVSSVEDDSQATYTLATDQPVLVDDLTTETRFTGPALLRNHDVRSGISTIIGPTDDPWGILATHDPDYRTFSENDATFVQAVANILAAAIGRHQHEQEVVHQREQLAALNTLNEVIREITSAVIEQSTRTEIEQTVCERLAGTDSYLFAWIGDVDPNTQIVNLRTEAGVERYLDDITISADPTDERSEGPTGRALQTGTIQVTYDLQNDSRYDPWRDSIEEYGFRSSAAVPIAHDDTIYGVLNIYAERPNAFTGQERTMLTQLGEVVGHAIAAAERKQALLSDELVELEFQIEDLFSILDAPVETEETITFEHTVAVGNGQFLVYGTATPGAMGSLRGLAETIPQWESVTVRAEGDPTYFELRLSDSSVLPVVASRGGYVDSAVIQDGDFHMTIHLAPTVGVRRIIDAVKEAYPEAKMVRRRQFTRVQDDLHPFNRQFVADLTDRQRSALEAAYYAGYFEWPRDTSGKGVAESLDVAPPTFHQHLRKAEQKVFETILSASR